MHSDREHSPERQAYWVERAQRLGIYSLINRGLLPRYADFSPALSSFHPQPARPRTCARTPTLREHEVAANLKPKSRPPSSKDKPDVTKTPHASEWALNATSSQHTDEGWVSASSAQIHIVNGRVLESTTLQSLLTAHPHHVIGNAVSVIQYLERTALLYAIDLIVLDSAALATLCTRYLPPWTALPTRRPSLDLLLPAIANWAHVHSLYTKPGRRYMGIDGHWAAIVKIQATWRMAMQRNKYLETCVSKTAAKVILEFRRKCLARAKFYERVMKQLETHTSTVSTLRTSLLLTYPTLHATAAWHVHIHLPSASLPDRIRFMMKDVTPYQTYHAGRLSSALSSDRARVMYISPLAHDPLVSVATRYLSRSTRYPRAASRTQVLVPEVLKHAPARAPLSLSVYASAALVNKVKGTLAGLGPRDQVLAVLVPYLVDAYDVRAASLMGVPMLALGVGRQEYFASRVGYFELMAAVEKREMSEASAHVPLDGPRGIKLSPVWPAPHAHVLGIEDESRVWTELASLVLAHPKVARWMLKIRDEAGRRGVVVFHRKRVMFGKYVERLEMHEVVDKIRAVPEVFTFLPPRIVVDAFGHPAQLYTLQQVAPEGGGNGNGNGGLKVVKRKAPIHLIRSNLGSILGSTSGSHTSLAVSPAKSVPTTEVRSQSPQNDTATTSTTTTRPTTTASHQAPFELPANTPLPTPAYPTVSAYLSSFCKSGGIIEALIDHPNGGSLTSSRSFFGLHIELHPTGDLQLHATWESIPLHDFDQCLLVLPARQVPPDVLMANVLKLTPALIERGIVGHVVVEFLAYMDQKPSVDLFCIDVKPYWSDTASLAGLAKIVMDARVDYPIVSGLTGKPLARQPRGDKPVVGDGVVGTGQYVTDMAHLRPANLRMATQAKWLDMKRLNAVADQVVKEQGVNTGEEVRCAVVLSGWVSSVLKEVGWVTMNATLQACEAEMNDTMRRGVLFLGDPHKSALAIDRTVTQCIQSLRDALLILHHRFQGAPLSEHTCNLHSICDLLNRMQPVYLEIESPANPLLVSELDAITAHARMHRFHDPVPDTVTSDAYFASVLQDNVAWMKTPTYTKLFAVPAAPVKDQDEDQSPEAKRTAEDMYAAALLAQEIYNLGRKIAEFSKQGASMTKFNTLLNAEITDTENKRRVRKNERKRDVKRSLRADREAAMRLAAGGMSVAEAEAEKNNKERRKSVVPGKGAGDADEGKQPQQVVGTGAAGGGGPQIVVGKAPHQEDERNGDNEGDSDSDSDSSDSSSGSPLNRSSDNARSPVELLAAGAGGGAASTNSLFSSTTLARPTAPQGKLSSNNVLKLMRGMFERVQEKVASSHHE